MKSRIDKVDAELINGKPYFGLWFGSSVLVHGDGFVGAAETNPIMSTILGKINSLPDRLLRGEEIRYKEIIVKPPLYANPLNSYGTVGYKYVIWGRAFRVMNHLKKGVRRWRKMRRSGKIKWVRVDR